MENFSFDLEKNAIIFDISKSAEKYKKKNHENKAEENENLNILQIQPISKLISQKTVEYIIEYTEEINGKET